MGKSAIINRAFSIAFCMFTRMGTIFQVMKVDQGTMLLIHSHVNFRHGSFRHPVSNVRCVTVSPFLRRGLSHAHISTQWHCIKTWPTLAMKIRWLPSWLATSPSMFLELWGMSLYAPFGFVFSVMDFYCRCWLLYVMFDQIQYPFWVVDIIERLGLG